eukprot:scaffold486_cov254-Pinguiococcus_pyrenoidosus.AAC.3
MQSEHTAWSRKPEATRRLSAKALVYDVAPLKTHPAQRPVTRRFPGPWLERTLEDEEAICATGILVHGALEGSSRLEIVLAELGFLRLGQRRDHQHRQANVENLWNAGFLELVVGFDSMQTVPRARINAPLGHSRSARHPGDSRRRPRE